MDVMVKSDTKPAGRRGPRTSGSGLKRLEFEMALEISDTGGRPLAETVKQAAQAAGGDLLFVLPAPDGDGVTAIVRLLEDGENHFIQVRTAEQGLAIRDEGEIAPELLGFARASIDVLERLRADRNVLVPLALAR